MDKSIIDKLESIIVKFNILNNKLNEVDTFNDTLYVDLNKEYNSLKEITDKYILYKKINIEQDSIKPLLNDPDINIRSFAKDEFLVLNAKLDTLEKEIFYLLNPKDKIEDCNIYLEIRAATGGDEASIFADDLFKMYTSYFLSINWKYEIMSFSDGNIGGYKDVILRVVGSNVLEKMRYESGIHRVQRVPKTENKGRVHTSTCSVAVLPEIKILNDISLDFNDLRIDTYRASGAGGQHVNVTDSAVRITHKPTGIVAECQDERSQHKNKQKALVLLKSKIIIYEKNKQKHEVDSYRRNLIGSGFRSEKIRTYNYPDNRITDHRFNLTLHKLSYIMNGNLNILLDCIIK